MKLPKQSIGYSRTACVIGSRVGVTPGQLNRLMLRPGRPGSGGSGGTCNIVPWIRCAEGCLATSSPIGLDLCIAVCDTIHNCPIQANFGVSI